MGAQFPALLCGLFLVVAASSVGAANATWNSGSKGDSAATFGIYDKGGSCEDLRSAMPLRIGTKDLKAGASSGPLQVKDLDFCLLFVTEPTTATSDGVTSNCASGSIDFSYDAKANEYHGKYDITMKNKTVRRGEYRAQFCKPVFPAKK